MNPQCWFCLQVKDAWEACAYNPKEKLVIVEKGILSKTYKVNPCRLHQICLDQVIWDNFQELDPKECRKLDLFFPLLSFFSPSISNFIPYHLKLNKKNNNDKNASEYDDNQKDASHEKETCCKTQNSCQEKETSPKTQEKDSSATHQEQH